VRNIATNAFISLPAGKFITEIDRTPVHFQLDGHLIAGFENPLHRIGLRPKKLLPFLVGGAQVAGAADATLRGDPVWKFLEDHIGTIESGHILGRS
jgi:hypothetical protein